MEWTHAKRMALEDGLRSGESITDIAKRIGTTRTTVLAEIKLCVGERAYENKNYNQYSAGNALLQYFIKKTGEDKPGIAIADMLTALEREHYETEND